MPHGHCYLWSKDVLLLHVVSDVLIFISYFTIPLALVYLIKKRNDIPFNLVFWMFAGFILLCGTSHLMDVITTWKPYYRLEGTIKLLTAIVSAITAVTVWFLIPKALMIPSRQEIKAKNIQLKAANEELKKFSFIAAHDLKEPLRKMITFSSLLKQENKNKLSQESESHLDKIHEAALRMTHLVKDLYKYINSTNNTSNEKYNEKVDLNNIIYQAISDLEITIQETQTQIEKDDFPIIDGCSTELKIVFQNIINNAIKYQPQNNTPIIQIKKHQITQDNIIIHIIDNGISVDLKYKDKIFEPFQRLHRSNEYSGTGMGLAICKKVLTNHNGKIDVINNKNQGACFIITLPLKQNFS